MIDVEIYFSPEDLSQGGIKWASSDGSPLSSQDILDAVSEALLYHYDFHDLESRPFYDS